jgi:hypothetical protein
VVEVVLEIVRSLGFELCLAPPRTALVLFVASADRVTLTSREREVFDSPAEACDCYDGTVCIGWSCLIGH